MSDTPIILAKIVSLMDELQAQGLSRSQILEGINAQEKTTLIIELDAGDESVYQSAVKIGREEGHMACSLLQRRLQCSYTRASLIVQRMKSEGRLNGKPRWAGSSSQGFLSCLRPLGCDCPECIERFGPIHPGNVGKELRSNPTGEPGRPRA